ncbi:MAG: hypothetical protein AAGA84_05475 [Pseudomonadota bacterium]
MRGASTNPVLQIFKGIAGVIGLVAAQLLMIAFLIIAGAAMIGFGIYKQWTWLIYGGVILVVVGISFVMRDGWWGD